MIVEEDAGKFSVTLSEPELWIIANQCGEGLIYGMSEFSDETLSEAALESALNNLRETGAIWIGPDGEESIDELIFGMVYSCMYSRDMMTIRNNAFEKGVYFHFLPDWNLSFSKIPDGYLLVYYQNRDVLQKHFITQYLSNLKGDDSEVNFHCTRVPLEEATYLWSDGKPKEGIELISEFMEGDKFLSEAFLQDIVMGNKYEVNAHFNRNNDHSASCKIEILVGEESNYLVRRIFSVKEDKEVLHVQGMPPELILHSVYQLM